MSCTRPGAWMKLFGCLAAATPLLVAAMWSASPATGQTPPATTKPSAVTKPVDANSRLDTMLKPPDQAGRILPIEPDPKPVDESSGAATVAPVAPQLNLTREGTYVVDRIGRLTRGADGVSQEFTFESDGRAMQDPPMVILPNLKLMAMENAVAGAAKDLRFSITGMVTEYHGRNYVLLEKVTVAPDVPR